MYEVHLIIFPVQESFGLFLPGNYEYNGCSMNRRRMRIQVSRSLVTTYVVVPTQGFCSSHFLRSVVLCDVNRL